MNRLPCAFLIALALLGAGPAAGQTTPRAAELGQLSQSLEGVVTKVGPAVVQIRVVAYGPVTGGARNVRAISRAHRWTATGAAHGLDVDEQGYGTVTEQRLYQLIRQPKPIGDRQFEIEFFDPGVEAFAFTFG